MILFRRNEEGQILQLHESAEGGKCWHNLDTSRYYLFQERDLKRFKIYQAQTQGQIDDMRKVLSENLDYGWITPAGNFWGCKATGHEFLISTFFGIDRKDAEKAGWIHLTPATWTYAAKVHGNNRLISEEQKERLGEIGRDWEHPDIKDENVKFFNAYPSGYPLGCLPGHMFTLYRHIERQKKPILHGAPSP